MGYVWKCVNTLNIPEKARVCYMSTHLHSDKKLVLIAFIVLELFSIYHL